MKVIETGGRVRIIQADKIGEKLDVGNYAVGFSQNEGFFLNKREPFDLPSKIYGCTTFPDRIMKTFNARKRGMGVLLSGPKGTGKTVEAKITCNSSNMPCIFITDGFTGSNFSEFLDSIKTPSVIYIDEFEKVYADNDDRNFFLSVMDGTNSSRHLFLLTSNEERIGEYFESRPGRVRYHKKYDFLDDEMILSIIEDRLQHKQLTEKVRATLLKISSLSVDSAVSIIDECNIHNETPDKFVEFFNVKSTRESFYDLELRTTIWKPRQGLDEIKIMRANQLISNYERNYFGEDDHDFETMSGLAEKREVTFTAHFSDPFYDNEDEDEVPHLNINRMTDASGAARSFDWPSERIVSFNENRKGFTAVHKNGDVLIAKTIKRFRAAF